MKTTELVEEAQKKALLFNLEIENMLMEDEGDNIASKKVAIILLEFANLAEEIYNRVIKRQTSKRVASHKVLKEMKYCSMDSQLIECLSKVKQFRNRIAHSIVLEQPVIGYFKKELVGLDRVAKIKFQMNTILQNAKDDVEYAYVFVEAS